MTDKPKLSTPVLSVTMADGSSHEVQIYNKDMLAWDRTRVRRGWPEADKAPIVWMTFLAWTALTRESQIPAMTLDEFENDALEVTVVTDEDGEETNADPTQRAADPI